MPESIEQVELPWNATRFAQAMGVDLRTFKRMYQENKPHFPKPLNPNSRFKLWPAEEARQWLRGRTK
jgi:predicted DNA-binding transcriptional regulator AlpA